MTSSRLTWSITFDERHQVLVVRTAGVLDLASAERLRREGYELLKQHACTRCLLDHTRVEADALGTVDIYDIPKMYAALGIPRSIRMAVVGPAHMEANLSFFETVCANSGYFVSLFDTEAAALEWLVR